MKVIHAVCALPLCIGLLGSCASAPRATFTQVDEMATVATGARNIRYLADAPADTYKGARHAIVQQGRPFIYLALSGGGAVQVFFCKFREGDFSVVVIRLSG